MAAILQTTFSNTFSWMKILNFKESFFEVCSLGSNRQYVSIGSHNGLAPRRRLAIILTNDELTYIFINASLDIDELIKHFMLRHVLPVYKWMSKSMSCCQISPEIILFQVFLALSYFIWYFKNDHITSFKISEDSWLMFAAVECINIRLVCLEQIVF